MDDTAILESLVRRTAARRRWVRGWISGWTGALVGTAVFLAVLVAFKVAPVPPLWLAATGAFSVASVVAGFLAGFLRAVNLRETAQWLDARAGLHDRISTALEVAANPRSPADWRALVTADATRAAEAVDPRTFLPFALPRSARTVGGIALAALVLAFVPEFRSSAFRRRASETAVIRDVGTNLTALARQSLKERPAPAEPVRREVEAVAGLGERLQSASLTRNEALAELARAADQMQKQAEELAQSPALRRMERAARDRSDGTANTAAALQKRIQGLAEKLGQKAAENPEAVDQLKNDLRKLNEQAKAMAGDPAAPGSEAMSKAAASAADLARRAEALGLGLPDLNEAVAALQGAQVERFLKNLEQATTSLEKLAAQASQMAQLQKQADRQGKDLAEQLQNGQAELAMESLKRLMDSLDGKNGGTKAQDDAAGEVERSVKPAGEYGKVADHLKRALQKSKGRDAQGARSALADARQELQRLMDEMGDAQQMMAALDGLKAAQAAVGNGTGWGQQPGGKGKPRSGPGGKGGKGVGTWSENNAWAFPEAIEDTWDNSGVSRPDQAAKGNTDREATRPDTLTPTKIQGQFQPGGPMPSITLKGVSIKGSSKVAYAEAVTAAQAEARSALSEDQVPKAYRGAVRDYFDDLKR